MTRKKQHLTLETIQHRCRDCGGCWEYLTDAKTDHHRMYPQVKHDGKVYLVRRLAFELASGKPLDDALRVAPVCGNDYCINPAHQEAMTESKKCKLAAKRGAFSSVTRARNVAEARRQSVAKLTKEEADAIRSSTESGPVLSARYGICKSRVNAIKRGEGWKEYGGHFAGLGARP